MSPWLGAILVESVMTVLFGGVLFSVRRSLTAAGLAFWAFVWILRGAASLFAIQYLSAAEHSALILYAPIQIAFALALAAVTMRMEHQKELLQRMQGEVERLRSESANHREVDPLTGLRNRTALAAWMEEQRDFRGLIVVCDMDDFKPLNDRYGHLVGDEILHGVGHLIRNSIREDDLAFRWGGDEFVIIFRTEDLAPAETRMRQLEERLRTFHIRLHGPTAVRFSWGVARATGRPLREALEEADRLMYEAKRARREDPPTGATAGG
jgi:diguanylate cyclase (GGDEF)-like protein